MSDKLTAAEVDAIEAGNAKLARVNKDIPRLVNALREAWAERDAKDAEHAKDRAALVAAGNALWDALHDIGSDEHTARKSAWTRAVRGEGEKGGAT